MTLPRVNYFSLSLPIKCLFLLGVFSLVATSAAVTGASSNNDGTIKSVITLNAHNFDSSIRDGNVWLVEFYAPWCGHCTKFAPEYQTVAESLHSMHKSKPERKIMVAKVDGAAERAIASRFNIQGYPSFFLIDGWTVRQYEGKRSAQRMVKFATETYEEVEPMPFMHSPFGPIGQLRALLMYIGTKVKDCYDWLIAKGLSSVVAAAIISSVGITVGLISIIIIGVLTLPKVKED